jgi:hypothetical protein
MNRMVSWMTEACKTCRFRLNNDDGECIFCRTRNDLVLYIQSDTRRRAGFANQVGTDVSKALEAVEWGWSLISDAVLFNFIL